MATYQTEKIHDIFLELMPMVERHWCEIALYKDEVPLDVDWQQYINLDAMGALNVVTARENGKLIGYCVDFVLEGHLHYKSTPYAINDVLFVEPEYRGATVGMRMLKFAEETLKNRGTKIWILHSKCHASISKLFERLGFQKADEQYSKVM